MLLNIKTETCYCGEDFDEVYEFADGMSIESIYEYADELAFSRANDFGTEEQAEEEGLDADIMAYVIFLEEENRESIIKEYGEILKP